MKMKEYFPFNLKNGYKSNARARAHTHTPTHTPGILLTDPQEQLVTSSVILRVCM